MQVHLPEKQMPIPTPENVTVDAPTLASVHKSLTTIEAQLRLRVENVTGSLREFSSGCCSWRESTMSSSLRPGSESRWYAGC